MVRLVTDWREAIRGFYAVLDASDEELARDLLSVSAVLQLRIKGADTPGADTPGGDAPGAGALLHAARAARVWTANAGALLVVNDRLDVALAADADAVHLGQDDLALADARRVADAQRVADASRPARRLLIGVSTHDLVQVAAARDGGADYIGFGPVYATRTKRNADPVRGIELLAAAVKEAGHMPVVAIGGITPARATEVAATGAAAACCISSVNGAADRTEAARQVAAAFARPARS